MTEKRILQFNGVFNYTNKISQQMHLFCAAQVAITQWNANISPKRTRTNYMLRCVEICRKNNKPSIYDKTRWNITRGSGKQRKMNNSEKTERVAVCAIGRCGTWRLRDVYVTSTWRSVVLVHSGTLCLSLPRSCPSWDPPRGKATTTFSVIN